MDQFWAKVQITSLCGCWEWAANRSGGYGRIKIAGKARLAHRVSYEMMKGKIPPEYQVHHRCENRMCVNPLHLESLTAKAHSREHRHVLSRCSVCGIDRIVENLTKSGACKPCQKVKDAKRNAAWRQEKMKDPLWVAAHNAKALARYHANASQSQISTFDEA